MNPGLGFELGRPGLGDLQGIAGLRVASGPCGLVHDLEGSEAGDRHLVLGRHGRLDGPQNRFESRGGLPPAEPRLGRGLLDQLALVHLNPSGMETSGSAYGGNAL